MQITGLWIPLVTPMYHGKFDSDSMRDLMNTVEPHVDGYVPCLSSGEGGLLSDSQWIEVVKTVRAKTTKPVIAGIKRKEIKSIIRLARSAEKLGCEAVVIPVPFNSDDKNIMFFKKISEEVSLPIIIYNTETTALKSVRAIREVDRIENIIAIKDSSKNMDLFTKLIKLRKIGKLRMSVLQGMENQLLESIGCDGYLISLANTEPKLCNDMFGTPSAELNRQIMEKWEELDLASKTWYVGIKKALASRGIIRSPELIQT